MLTREVDIDAIVIEERIRIRPVDESLVAHYAERMGEGDKFPPVKLREVDGVYVMAAGHHRYGAARLRGSARLLSNIEPGTLDDALLDAIEENRTHGRPMSEDGRKIAVRKLLLSATWGGKPQTWIAERCGVVQSYVSKIKADMEEAGELSLSDNSGPTRGRPKGSGRNALFPGEPAADVLSDKPTRPPESPQGADDAPSEAPQAGGDRPSVAGPTSGDRGERPAGGGAPGPVDGVGDLPGAPAGHEASQGAAAETTGGGAGAEAVDPDAALISILAPYIGKGDASPADTLRRLLPATPLSDLCDALHVSDDAYTWKQALVAVERIGEERAEIADALGCAPDLTEILESIESLKAQATPSAEEEDARVAREEADKERLRALGRLWLYRLPSRSQAEYAVGDNGEPVLLGDSDERRKADEFIAKIKAGTLTREEFEEGTGLRLPDEEAESEGLRIERDAEEPASEDVSQERKPRRGKKR